MADLFAMPGLLSTELLGRSVDFVTPRERARNMRRARVLRPRGASLREKRRVDLSCILPRPVFEGEEGQEQIHFPLAESAGVRHEQLELARIEYELGLCSLANRQAHCGIVAKKRVCSVDPANSRFFKRYGCGNRFCPYCGPRNYRRLFARHIRQEPFVERVLREHPHWVVAKLDFTTRNTGQMTEPGGVRKFNRNIRKFFRLLERRKLIRKRAWGAIGCNEFGGKGRSSLPGRGSFRGNTNLHSHYVYIGPRLPQSKKMRELSALWSEVRGERSFVSIKHAKSFADGLGHSLKYAGKFLSHDPRRLAQLEKAFHRVRRVHSFGLLYNAKPEREPGADEKLPNGFGRCPDCGAPLGEVVECYQSVRDLEAEGWRDLETARSKAGRRAVFGGKGPPGVDRE
jgi:hypothetical protein